MAVAIIDSRRQRVNVESMVSFDGVAQNATVTNPNLDAGVQAVSFFVNVNSSLSIAKGAWSFTETGLPVNSKVHVVIQGGRLFINSVDTAAATNFPANTDALVFSGASLLSHFCAFNRTLTPAEISYIHAQGGLLPASTHAACVAHYPCTQREGNILFDVVEQYNYAKATALVPYHATLQNFSAAQHTGDAQSAYKDFYTKTDLRPYVDSNSDGTPDSPLIEKSSLLPPLQKALSFNGTNQYANVSNFIPTKELGYTYVFAIYISNNFTFSKIEGIYSKRDSSNQNKAIFGTLGWPNANSFQHYNNDTSDSTVGKAVSESTPGFANNKLQFFVTTEKDYESKMYRNGVLVKTDVTANTILGFNNLDGDLRIGTEDNYLTSRNYSGHIVNFGIAKGIATPKQIKQLWNNGLLANPEKSWSNLDWQLWLDFNQIIDNNGTYQIANNGSAGGNATLSGYTAANLDPLDPSYALTDINSLR